MRKNVNEIENVLKTHGYSVNIIICDVMKIFKFKSLCRQVGFQKQEGYSPFEIISLMLIFPLMLLKSVNALYRSEFQKVTSMKKDTIYRLKNNENMPWRNLLLSVAKTFMKKVNPNKEVALNSAFILDDTTEAKTGRRIEQISYVYDHVAGKKGSKLGFKNLTLGLFDGKSLLALDFSLHSEKLLKGKYKKEQYHKNRAPKSHGAKRKRECSIDKISNGLQMLKRAVKHGFRAKYVLVDSWFSSKTFIITARNLADKTMHVICGVRFEVIKDELLEKNVAERLWELFEELLQTIINAITESGILDIKEFKNSLEYQYLKGLFEDSFLGN